MVAIAIWLAWQIICAPLAERGPPEVAIRLLPNSASVLARAAEAEFASRRYDNAEMLARSALAQAPFSVTPMRVLAQVLDEKGQSERADELMTLAGNWSLRDSSAHGWLVTRRLEQGDYVSAFGHADTLLRRSDSVWPQGFALYAAGAEHDPHALAALRDILARSPPWRRAFIYWLRDQEGHQMLLGRLAVEMHRTPQPFTTQELEVVYLGWLSRNEIPAIKFVRERIGHPSPSQLLVDGDFTGTSSPRPFGWDFAVGTGLSVEVIAGEERGRSAVRVAYNGRRSGYVVRQLLTLPPGDYTLTGQRRVEQGEARLDWVVRCLETGQIIGAVTEPQRNGREWNQFSMHLAVPLPCLAQWLELSPRLSNYEENSVIWFSQMSLVRK